MTYLATKINCDGDKCGECEKLITDIPVFDIGGVFFCRNYDKEIIDGHRLPECLAGELVEDCEFCKYEHLLQYEYPCSKCNPGNINSWQPATKGER